MNLKILPLLALAAFPVLAQDKWQVALGFNHLDQDRQDYAGTNLAGANSLINFKRESRTVPSVLVGYRIKDFAKSDLTLSGEYLFRAGYDASMTSAGTGLANSYGTVQKHYFAPGLMWNFHPTVDLGVGLQYRFERLRSDLTAPATSTNHDRPWLNLYLGYTFQSQAQVKPFVALRSSAALSTTSAPANGSDLATEWGQRRLLRSMGGDVESSLQVGVRF